MCVSCEFSEVFGTATFRITFGLLAENWFKGSSGSFEEVDNSRNSLFPQVS